MPRIAHSEESLSYLEKFTFKDDDIFAVTYPKSIIFGKWIDHVKRWRILDLGDRILYVTYEEMLQSIRGVLEQILTFLGRQLSGDALDRVVDHCTFKNMKTNTMSNYSLVPQDVMDRNKSSFLRKGIAGDWKNHFSPELDVKFTAAIQEEMKGSNIKFPWDEE
ncbi:sulfotransferase 2B1-like [Myxocyprinus asiaticus]|uniref:sulfotransferase 2B1-like n=1 Tax=Myxocyprinus asiaticus TaxID=70543 RepID=UPI002223BC22|nr:sulfotransferase 2B1-like [Myxocyprinus asiaticus]